MIDPTFPLAFTLWAAKQVNDYTDGWAVDVTKGVLGNFTHGLLEKGAKRALTIIKSRKEESNGNHDLMKALRRSMLDATGQIPVAKSETEEKTFRHWLQKWLDQQLEQLNDLDSWHDWNNSAIGELELFFDHPTNFHKRKQQLIQKMTDDWSQYLQTQEILLPIPESFILKISNGWQEQNHKITWWELVMLTFETYVRSRKTPEAQQAEKALVHNFLAELKMEIKEMGEEIKQIQPQLQEIMDLMKKSHPSSSQLIDKEWKQMMASLVEANKNLTEIVKSQQEDNSILIKNLDEKERIIATLSSKNQFINEEQQQLLDKFKLEVAIIRAKLEPNDFNIPTIKSVLRKKEISEGDFFKKEPEWVDYEQGFIVERKEVDEIIKKLETNKVQLVLGAPASGKSIILKNVGFKLADKKKVYVVELKKHLQDEIKLFFENIPKIDDYNSLFIIDDAHLYLSECERLIKNFKRKGKGNLIIGSRESREITEEHPKEGAEYELLSELSKTCIHIQAEDVTERMIRTFLEKQYQFNEDKIKIISDNLVKYKEDLWFLSWALKAYNSKKNSVDDDEIYEKIAYSIEKIKIGKEKETINAEDVLLPLSVFFRYEIPLERKYLEEELELDGKIINQLIGLQEIGEMKKNESKILSLNHSSIAELYFGAYLRLPDLGRRIKKNILNGKDEKYLEFCSFCRYLTTTDSRNAVDVVISFYNRYYLDENDGSTILKKLIEIDKIQKSIGNGINKEEDIGHVGSCLSGIARAKQEVALKLTNSIDINVLSSKINKEEDIGKVRSCLLAFAWVSKEVAMKLVDSISAKIDTEDDIGRVGSCLSVIAQASKEVAMSLANSIDIGVLSSKINKEEDIGKVRLCVSGIALASEEAAMKLVKSISAKINTEDDIGRVGSCLSVIAHASKEVALGLANNIDINVLSSKINKEEDIGKVRLCVSGITLASEEVAMKLVESISAKIDTEEDIRKVGSFVSGIALASEEMAMKLVDSISAKIDAEEDIGKVGWCVLDIARASKEVAMSLANSIDINVLSSKINKEKDIGRVGWCILNIAQASKEVALNLSNSIDINVLSSKINKEEDIGKVHWSSVKEFYWAFC